MTKKYIYLWGSLIPIAINDKTNGKWKLFEEMFNALVIAGLITMVGIWIAKYICNEVIFWGM